MKTIGLIGAENSHARHFCDVINGAKAYPGYRITCVYGEDDPAAAERLCADFGLEGCASEDEVIARCDAVVITYRRGSQHFQPAMKALRAGRAVFNDKPFTTDPASARALCDYARQKDLLLCGGSNIKGLGPVPGFAARIKPGVTLVISFAADPASPYDGYWFYGIHAVELCLAICGRDYCSVTAFKNGDNVVATVAYADYHCVLSTTPTAAEPHLSLADGAHTESWSLPLEYQGVSSADLVGMMETGKPPRDVGFYADAVALLGEIIAKAEL